MASAAIRRGLLDEHNFRLTFDGTSVRGNDRRLLHSALTNLHAGLVHLPEYLHPGATPTSLVEADMNIFDATDTLLSSTAVLGNSDGGMLESANPRGTWLYLAAPSGRTASPTTLLGIDNVARRRNTGAEPASIVLLTSGLVLAAGAGAFRPPALRRVPASSPANSRTNSQSSPCGSLMSIATPPSAGPAMAPRP